MQRHSNLAILLTTVPLAAMPSAPTAAQGRRGDIEFYGPAAYTSGDGDQTSTWADYSGLGTQRFDQVTLQIGGRRRAHS